jgi:hypothetical protein
VSDFRARSRDAAIVAAIVLLSGVAACWLGQDVSGDLRSYHFYNGYALLTGRLDRDVAGAALGSYFNPMMDAFHYWGMTHLPARLFGFLLGAIHGFDPAFVYLIARRLRAARGPALAAGLLAGIGPTAVLVLGTASGDSLATLPALAALWLVLATVESPAIRPRWHALLVAGLLSGAATGGKLTMAPYSLALTAAVLMATPGAASIASFLAGSAAGYLLIAGYWSAQLWFRFGNPLFPFANQLFHSPFLGSIWLNDPRWLARSVGDYLRPPVDALLGRTEHLGEFPFRDPRFLLVEAAALAVAVRRLLATRQGDAGDPSFFSIGERLFLTYVAVGYGLWLVLFHYERYMLPLELLMPVALYVLLRALLTDRFASRLAPIFVAVVVAAALATRYVPRAWGRSPLWRDGWFDVRMPRLGTMAHMAVLIDMPANSFVLPYFPVDARILNLRHEGAPRFDEEIARILGEHTGPILYTPPIGERRLAPFGLRDAGHCEVIKTSHGNFGLCVAERIL